VTVGQGFYRNGQRSADGHHPPRMLQAYEGRVTRERAKNARKKKATFSSGLFRYLVAGAGFEPTTFGL
jgi:hypothetical protein